MFKYLKIKIDMVNRMFLVAVSLFSILGQQVIADDLIVPHADYILCIDGRGSKTSLQVVTTQGVVIPLQGPAGIVQEIYTEGSNVASLGWDFVQKRLEKLLNQVKFPPGNNPLQDKNSFAVVAGFAGIGLPEIRQKLIDLFQQWGLSPDKIVVTTDINLAKELLSQKDGAVLIAGLGSVAFVKHQGHCLRFGGLGWYLGDEGSGFSVGKKAIAAAIAEDKGFGMKTALTPILKEMFQQQELYRLIPLLQDGTISSEQVAGIAPIVFECAYNKKDPVAHLIVKLAAQELASLIRQGIEMIQKELKPLPANWPIYLIGGQFRGPYAQAWTQELWSFLPQRGKMVPHNLAKSNTTTVVVQQKLATRRNKRGW
ncbi:MAG: N-acetylglucosamine kinase [Candidatus Amoebophilus sp.]